MRTSRLKVALGLIGAVVLFAATAGAQQRPSPAPGGAATSTPASTTSPAAPNAARPVPPISAAPADYVIGTEDVLAISVWKNETLSRTVPVRPDGKISLPLLNDIQAAGLTAMQLREKIAGALTEFMPNPEVSVIVTDVRSKRVSVLGEVGKPGIIPIRSDTTILEAIALVGGFGPFASPSKITIFRKEGTETRKIRFNYKKAISEVSQENNIVLKDGDVIVVP